MSRQRPSTLPTFVSYTRDIGIPFWSSWHRDTGPLRHPLVLGRHDGATRRSARARARAFGMFYWGGKNEYETIGVARHERAPFRRTTRGPSTCGCSPRVRSGLPPREDHASNPVGLVWGVIGLVGWRRLFQAVRHIGRKWATCTPSAPRRPSRTHGPVESRSGGATLCPHGFKIETCVYRFVV